MLHYDAGRERVWMMFERRRKDLAVERRRAFESVAVRTGQTKRKGGAN
jgi:hypothetical protein